MNPRIGICVLAAIAGCCGPDALRAADAAATNPAGAKKAPVPERVWSFTPDPNLPDVMILGDSISVGYTLEVRALLKDRANVFRPVSDDGTRAENCAGTTKGVQAIDRWLGGRKWSVIHFNFGLHDLKHVAKPGDDAATSHPHHPRQAGPVQYRRNLEAIVQRLKSTGARLVFATTTPVAPDTRNPLREPDAPPRYNAVALEIMRSHGIRVNDLHAFCAPQLDRIQQPNNVHFTPAGCQVLAREVARVITEELPARPPSAGR